MAPDQAGPGAGHPALEPAQRLGLPVLYSFRRCPYAIRARLALAAAELVPEIDLVVREVSLACKPPELLLASAKGTVPVLVLPPGSGAEPAKDMGLATVPNRASPGSAPGVIEESLGLMTWALARRDPGDWLRRGKGPTARASQAEMAALIAENDGPFKHHLDRFKYPNRFKPDDLGRKPGGDPVGDSNHVSPGNGAGPVHLRHRAAALRILERWNQRLQAGAWLLGPGACLADWALLPFVRQFRRADPAGFDAEPNLDALRAWLGRFEASTELATVLDPPWGRRQAWRSPHWLYHLALPEEWRQARAAGIYARSTRGLGLEQVGFIHASYAHQLAATYARFYGDAGPVVLLTIDPALLEQAGVAVRAEAAGSNPAAGAERFPHLYGPLPLAAVLAADPYQP
jgi:glutathione S-transferase